MVHCPNHFLPARRLFLTAAFGALAAAGCSPIQAFDSVAGRDAGARRVVTGASFGPAGRQALDVYAPEGTQAGQRLPIVMFIYGGSWSDGRRQDYGFAGAAFAARGFVTVVADYRLVPEVVFPDFLRDGALALRWIRSNIAAHGGDPSRIALVGHSAGAYNAVMLGLDRRYLREAGVDPGSVRAVAGLAGPYDFLPFDGPITPATFGCWPNPAETQPVNLAHAGAPPMFLATGDADTTVQPRNTLALAARLRARGVSVEQRIYPGVGHAGLVTGLSANFRSAVLDDVTAFLRARLGAGA